MPKQKKLDMTKLNLNEALENLPSEDFYEWATRENRKRSYCRFAIKGSMVVAAVDSDSDLTMIECKFDQFKKLTSKAAKKEAGTTHVHLWEYGVNSIDAFNEQPLIEITDE